MKSPKVGQMVVVDLLPELLSGLVSLEGFFQIYANECPDSAVCALAFSSLASVREAIVSASTAKGVSSRLALERSLGRDVPNLEGCLEVCELWTRAGLGQTTELRVRDIFGSLFVPSNDPSAFVVSLPADALPFEANPSVAAWLMRALLTGAPPGAAFVAFAGERGPEVSVRPTSPVGTRMALRAPSPRVVHGALDKIAARAGIRYEGSPMPTLIFSAPPRSEGSILSSAERPRE